MFCPGCSQEQVSAETRYCSRCGFLLDDVAEALENDGFVKRDATEQTAVPRRAIALGLLFIVASVVFFIASLIMGTPEPSFLVQLNLFVALFGLIIGLGIIVYHTWLRNAASASSPFLSEKSIKKGSPVTVGHVSTAPAQIPDTYSEPARVPTTRGLQEVPSVVDNTTKLLDNDR